MFYPIEDLTQQQNDFLGDLLQRCPEMGSVVNQIRWFSWYNQSVHYDIANNRLDTIKRAGWVKRGIIDPESDFEHSFAVSRKAFLDCPEGINPADAAIMSLFHDIQETLISDFIPNQISKNDKYQLELIALDLIFAEPQYANEKQLCIEYMEQKTPLSHWVHDIDKLDPCFVAFQYENTYPDKVGIFKEFTDYTKPRLKTDTGKEIFRQLMEDYESGAYADYKIRTPEAIETLRRQAATDFLEHLRRTVGQSNAH